MKKKKKTSRGRNALYHYSHLASLHSAESIRHHTLCLELGRSQKKFSRVGRWLPLNRSTVQVALVVIFKGTAARATGTWVIFPLSFSSLRHCFVLFAAKVNLKKEVSKYVLRIRLASAYAREPSRATSCWPRSERTLKPNAYSLLLWMPRQLHHIILGRSIVSRWGIGENRKVTFQRGSNLQPISRPWLVEKMLGLIFQPIWRPHKKLPLKNRAFIFQRILYFRPIQDGATSNGQTRNVGCSGLDNSNKIPLAVPLAVYMVITFAEYGSTGQGCQSCSGSAEQGKMIFPCPRACLRIWSRETSSTVPSRISLLILHIQAESTAYSRDSSRFPRRRPSIEAAIRHRVSADFIGSRSCVPMSFTTSYQ